LTTRHEGIVSGLVEDYINLFQDILFRSENDSNIKEVKVIKEIDSHSKIVYMKFDAKGIDDRDVCVC
jgi:hypothetical protein